MRLALSYARNLHQWLQRKRFLVKMEYEMMI